MTHRPVDLASLLLRIASTTAMVPLLGLACGGSVQLDDVAPGGGSDGGTSSKDDTTARTDAGRTMRDGGREASTPKPPVTDPPDVPIINVDAGPIDFSSCGEQGKRPSASTCDYYERQVPCEIAGDLPTGSLSPQQCATYCDAPPNQAAYCFVSGSGVARLLCNACPGGRRPAVYAPGALDDVATLEGAFFARLAELEAVSIEAFRGLADELVAHGAGKDLLSRVEAARSDEVRHAALVGELAHEAGCEVPGGHHASPEVPRELAVIALENAVEGCVRETYGALVAMFIARRATTPRVREIFSGIARDEANHAALSWDLHRWLDARLDASSQAAVRAAMLEAARELRREVAHGTSPRSLGVPGGQEAERLVDELARELWAA